jgi:putative serine/threonine protein kinase
MENLLNSENKDRLKFLLTYPSFDQNTYDKRIQELLSLDISSVYSFGKIQLHKIAILGKGSVGMVTLVRCRNRYFVLKIRRTDANRANMYDEVLYQSLANSIGIGPFLLNFSENFILMEYIKGSNILDWYNSKNSTCEKILKCTCSILQQCFHLDRIKLDHGQLNRLDKHIIISNDGIPTILDFETSSTKRMTGNVTNVSQSFFLNGPIYDRLRDSLDNDNKQVIKIIKDYKKNLSHENFEKILNLLKF